jgi:small subunit ribosomal protein S5
VRKREQSAIDALSEVTLSLDRVTRVVKGGRRFRFRATVIVGDGKGGVGLGIAKGGDVALAISKAVNKAKKNMIIVPINRTTIAFTVTGRQDGSKILMKPAVEGTGLKAGTTTRTILEVAGISDVISKSFGSTNKINLAYATIKALAETIEDDKKIDTATEDIKQPEQVDPESTQEEATSKESLKEVNE